MRALHVSRGVRVLAGGAVRVRYAAGQDDEGEGDSMKLDIQLCDAATRWARADEKANLARLAGLAGGALKHAFPTLTELRITMIPGYVAVVRGENGELLAPETAYRVMQIMEAALSEMAGVEPSTHEAPSRTVSKSWAN